jgi:hypothetical protein
MTDYVWKLTQAELHHKQNFAWEQGILHERERIIELIEDFQTQFGTGWDTVYSEGFASGIGECLALIKGENE